MPQRKSPLRVTPSAVISGTDRPVHTTAPNTGSPISLAEPLLVPLSEAARLLGVRVYSVRRLTRKGLLPHKVIGNKWLIPYASLKAFANNESPNRQAAA
jgi:excisionase family DNA binding protein